MGFDSEYLQGELASVRTLLRSIARLTSDPEVAGLAEQAEFVIEGLQADHAERIAAAEKVRANAR